MPSASDWSSPRADAVGPEPALHVPGDFPLPPDANIAKTEIKGRYTARMRQRSRSSRLKRLARRRTALAA